MFLAYKKISFYIVAHADDWQLFMQPAAYYDIIDAGCKVVFIITTSGDAGFGENFWRCREEGCLSSIRYCLAAHESTDEYRGINGLNGRNLHFVEINNTKTYFLRLPDGNLDGNGFKENNHQSISKLLNREIQEISTTDHSCIYINPNELIQTIEFIFAKETGELKNISFHFQNPDTNKNPNDHADHIATGTMVKNAIINVSTKQFLYTGYSVMPGENKLSSEELFWKTGMFAAYEKTVFDLCGYSTIKEAPEIYQRWCASGAEFVDQ